MKDRTKRAMIRSCKKVAIQDRQPIPLLKPEAASFLAAAFVHLSVGVSPIVVVASRVAQPANDSPGGYLAGF